MTELPEWIQNVRDHADKARGPWWVTTTRDESGRSMYEVTTAPWKHAPNVFPLLPASVEKFVSHPDVPRLIELVAEMAKVLETVQDTCKDLAREDIHCVTEACCQFIDECETVLTKYWRGESDD